MSKRFTDTNKYRKPFIRSLSGAYKLLWDYLYHDCDHAGIWIVDFDIAQIYIGSDMPVNKIDALKYFNNGEQRIIEFDEGKKWFIPSFIEFQYGELNETNRAHKSVLNILRKNKLQENIKGLICPLEGCKDKDKDMDMVKDIDIPEEFFETFLNWLKYKRKRRETYKTKESTQKAFKRLLNLANNNSEIAREIVDQSIANNWAGLFELKTNYRKNQNGNFKSYTKI